MKTFPHSKLVRPDVLSELSRTSIVALLAPFADYFAARGTPLDAIADERTPIHDVMLVVATPSESTPAELVERLEMLDLISDAQSSDILIRASEIVDFAWAGRKIIWHNLA